MKKQSCRCSKTLLCNAKFLRLVCSEFKRTGSLASCNKKAWLQKSARIRCLCEILYNMCTGNVPLSRRTVDYLRSHEPELRTLLKSNLPLSKRKRIINQTGGLVPLVVQTALPYVVDFIDRFLKK
jgi:hypothetical protein